MPDRRHQFAHILAVFVKYAWITTGAGLVVLGVVGQDAVVLTLGVIVAAAGCIWGRIFDS